MLDHIHTWSTAFTNQTVTTGSIGNRKEIGRTGRLCRDGNCGAVEIIGNAGTNLVVDSDTLSTNSQNHVEGGPFHLENLEAVLSRQPAAHKEVF